MDITIAVLVVMLVGLAAFCAKEERNHAHTVRLLQDENMSLQDKQYRLMDSLKQQKEISQGYFNQYTRAYNICYYYDKILREIFLRYGDARIGLIDYNGFCNGIHEFYVRVNVGAKMYKPKEWEYGEAYNWNINERAYVEESFTLLIPDTKTPIEERFGKALSEMEFKFE